MFGRIVTTAAVGGMLTLLGMAATPAPASAVARHFNCARADKVLARIAEHESKDRGLLAKAAIREAAATRDKHPKTAKLVKGEMAVVEKREARAAKRMGRIELRCPGSSATASSSSTT